MFREAIKFNQNINSWDVSSVIFNEGMFDKASSFDKSNALWYDFD